jgi:hypothetical protein
MSTREIGWRVHTKVRSLIGRRLRSAGIHASARDSSGEFARPEEWVNPKAVGSHLVEAAQWVRGQPRSGEWIDALRERAELICDHRIDLFNLKRHDLGAEINWNHEYEAGLATPLIPSEKIDYRDYRVVGDCKLAWEPSRHYQLPVLGRAYRLTGEERYATEACRQLASWMDQCPFGIGMQWRSGLELGIRLINWTWTWALLEGAAALTRELRSRILASVEQHISRISGNYSRFSSANNHLVGEAAGVFIAAGFFDGLPRSARWRDEARGILSREIQRQTHVDGGTREQAMGYQLFVMWFYVLCGIVARNLEDDFPAEYWRTLERMFEFAAAMTEGGSVLPAIGDGDDGYVLDLGGRHDPVGSLLHIGAVLFARPEFERNERTPVEPGFWLFAPESASLSTRASTREPPIELRSRPLPASGYYLLQRGARGSPDSVSLIFDCGQLGFLSIAAHGHADALSVILRIGGMDVLVDPGTYDYFTHPKWREYFRSTRAHNTIAVDGQDQSEMVGPFMWGRQAVPRLLRWEPRPGGGTVVGEHDGYARLADPVNHRRSVSLDPDDDCITLRDEVRAVATHSIAQCWHFSENCEVTKLGEHEIRAQFPGGEAIMELDPALTVHLETGSETSRLGWRSGGYHSRVPIATAYGACQCQTAQFLTRIRFRTSENRAK